MGKAERVKVARKVGWIWWPLISEEEEQLNIHRCGSAYIRQSATEHWCLGAVEIATVEEGGIGRWRVEALLVARWRRSLMAGAIVVAAVGLGGGSCSETVF